MNCVAPQPIELTATEAKLYAHIQSPPLSDWCYIAPSMETLVASLLERDAVPKVRLRLFDDRSYTETRSEASCLQRFERIGTTGSEVFRHQGFIPYLRHFIDGPDLPQDAVEGLCTILDDGHGRSGIFMDEYRKHARSSVRKHGLNASKAATEFFRLGVEIGMEIDDARTLRDAAKSAR